MGDALKKFMPVIMAGLTTLLAILFLFLMVQAVDGYARLFGEHCELSNKDTTVLLHGYKDPKEKGPGLLATLDGTLGDACEIGITSGKGISTGTVSGQTDNEEVEGDDLLSTLTNKFTLFTEDGDSITFDKKLASDGDCDEAFAVTDAVEDLCIAKSEWKAPLPITQEMGGISDELVKFLPIVMSIATIASIWAGFGLHVMNESSTNSKFNTALVIKIVALMVLMIVVTLAPLILRFTQETSWGFATLSIAVEHDDLQNILFGVVPIILTVIIFGFALWDGVKVGMQFKEQGGFGAIKGMAGRG